MEGFQGLAVYSLLARHAYYRCSWHLEVCCPFLLIIGSSVLPEWGVIPQPRPYLAVPVSPLVAPASTQVLILDAFF